MLSILEVYDDRMLTSATKKAYMQSSTLTPSQLKAQRHKNKVSQEKREHALKKWQINQRRDGIIPRTQFKSTSKKDQETKYT